MLFCSHEKNRLPPCTLALKPQNDHKISEEARLGSRPFGIPCQPAGEYQPIWPCIDIHTNIYIYIYMCAHICTHACLDVYVYIRSFRYLCICLCTRLPL